MVVSTALQAVILIDKSGKLFPSVCFIITYYRAYYRCCVMPAFSSFISYSNRVPNELLESIKRA